MSDNSNIQRCVDTLKIKLLENGIPEYNLTNRLLTAYVKHYNTIGYNLNHQDENLEVKLYTKFLNYINKFGGKFLEIEGILYEEIQERKEQELEEMFQYYEKEVLYEEAEKEWYLYVSSIKSDLQITKKGVIC